MDVKLNPYQCNFIFNPSRYPCFVGGWGVGKTLSAIARAQLYSKGIPENLGIIFRKTFKSLQDSTMQDFKKYTKMHVDGNRNVTYPNGSMIMFRHLDEIDSINQQNINLGWAYIEQGEELETDKEFMMLFGRLRRDLKPTDEFIKLGLPTRSMWVIANAGDNWIKRLWKDKNIDGGELVEASTFDNAHNLPKDFLDSLEVIKKNKPEMYKQFVLNDWSVTSDNFTFIKPKELEALEGIEIHETNDKHLVAVDPSMGGDECVINAFHNAKVIDTLILRERDTMKVTGEIMIFMNKHNTDDVCVDSIGIGAGIADRLNELGKRVIRINSAESSTNNKKFLNLRANMWWYAMEQVQSKKCYYPTDELCRKQLTSLRYKVMNSEGKIQAELKADYKKRNGYSPDRADCWVYGIWALQFVEAIKKDKYARTRGYEYTFNPNTV